MMLTSFAYPHISELLQGLIINTHTHTRTHTTFTYRYMIIRFYFFLNNVSNAEWK